MDRSRKLTLEAIALSICAISKEIQDKYLEIEEIEKRAAAIKTLAEAYRIANH